MIRSCNNCHRSSEETDGWWRVIEHPTAGDYSLCPSCYRNRSLKTQREALVEALERITLGHSDPAINMGMAQMKTWCIRVAKEFEFET
jgi:Zn ribbon nucleic-acid-binding protein